MNRARQTAIIADANEGSVIGYSDQFGGVHVHHFEYGIDDALIVSYPILGAPKKHRARIYYTARDARPYILVYGRRLHLDEIMRTWRGTSLAEY